MIFCRGGRGVEEDNKSISILNFFLTVLFILMVNKLQSNYRVGDKNIGGTERKKDDQFVTRFSVKHLKCFSAWKDFKKHFLLNIY